jgi:hypothetical protein
MDAMAMPDPVAPWEPDDGGGDSASRGVQGQPALDGGTGPAGSAGVTPFPGQTARPLPLSGRPLSRRLVRAAGECEGTGERIMIGTLVAALGDRSFGWCILLFALINLIPMPFGAMITALPLILVSAQMALGFRELRLPRRITTREISRRRFQGVVMRLRPLMRPIERIVRPRRLSLFDPRNERLIGAVLLAVSIALFLPIPLSGWLPATALLVTGIGLVERDGLVAGVGLALGIVAVAVTATVAVTLILGAQILVA